LSAREILGAALDWMVRSMVVRAFVVLSLVWVVIISALAQHEPHVPYRELGVLAQVNDTVIIFYWVAAFATGFILMHRERRGGFERFATDPAPAPGSVAAGLGGAALVAFVAFVLLIALEVSLSLMAGGAGYVDREFVHLLLLGATTAPFVLVTMVLAAALPVYLAPPAALFAAAWSHDFAVDRGRAMDGFIARTTFVRIEEALYWAAPRPLVDTLTRDILVGLSHLRNVFAGYDGRAIYDDRLVLVSEPTDYAYWAGYMVVLAAVLYLAVRWRARSVRGMYRVPGWEGYARPG
jgi:hypothetical protein